MNASAFCDLWAQVTSHVAINNYEMHKQFMRLFVYYILTKITP